ncbi:MAG: hypothetical protein K1X94_36050, partial [Sandaracinaceae bacterium]|nr:hypothetical protein [Sandaracinaceae bacterium]
MRSVELTGRACHVEATRTKRAEPPRQAHDATSSTRAGVVLSLPNNSRDPAVLTTDRARRAPVERRARLGTTAATLPCSRPIAPVGRRARLGTTAATLPCSRPIALDAHLSGVVLGEADEGALTRRVLACIAHDVTRRVSGEIEQGVDACARSTGKEGVLAPLALDAPRKEAVLAETPRIVVSTHASRRCVRDALLFRTTAATLPCSRPIVVDAHLSGVVL